MKQLVWFAILVLIPGLEEAGLAQTPEVRMVNGKLSIQAEAAPLGSLLEMLDRSTGMNSKVPPELANRNVSVQFTDLSLNEGVRKIFEGQRLDYVFLGGRGIIVTSVSQASLPAESAPFSAQPTISSEPFNQNPFNPIQNDAFVPAAQPAPQPGQPGQQPAMIQTPFGPIPNPRANQGAQPVPVPGQNPQALPTQQNPFGNPGVFGAPSALSPTPLGDNSIFGSPQGPTGAPLGSGGIPGLTPSRP
jgi:hypothetical protein